MVSTASDTYLLHLIRWQWTDSEGTWAMQLSTCRVLKFAERALCAENAIRCI
jgi:hypothetical protein